MPRHLTENRMGLRGTSVPQDPESIEGLLFSVPESRANHGDRKGSGHVPEGLTLGGTLRGQFPGPVWMTGPTFWGVFRIGRCVTWYTY